MRIDNRCNMQVKCLPIIVFYIKMKKQEIKKKLTNQYLYCLSFLKLQISVKLPQSMSQVIEVNTVILGYFMREIRK